MNRIEERFEQLKRRGQKGFVVYIGAGDPDLNSTRELALAFDQAGVDILELGVPFSDPLADGVVNQLAAQRGLEAGTTPDGVLETVAAIRRQSQIPIVLYIYFNLIHKQGLKLFIQKAAGAGVDGLLILDLPPEESGDYETFMAECGLSNIYLVAPTTPDDRIALIVKKGRGFIYCVSREGVTGMRQEVSGRAGDITSRIRRHTQLPVAIGFGISNEEQAAAAARMGDAVVVGSAIVDRIAKLGRNPEMVGKVASFVQSLSRSVKSV